MMHRAWVRWAWTVGSLLLVGTGCSGSSTNDDDDDDENVPGAMGTPICQQWQNAICDFVDRCGGDSTVCRDQAPAVACISDAEAQRCSAALSSAACDGTVPAGCDLTEIADPAPAIEKCNVFIDTLCNRSEECDPGSRAACVMDATGSLDCSLAIGIKPSYDQCLSELATLDCMAASAPAACVGIVLQ